MSWLSFIYTDKHCNPDDVSQIWNRRIVQVGNVRRKVLAYVNSSKRNEPEDEIRGVSKFFCFTLATSLILVIQSSQILLCTYIEQNHNSDYINAREKISIRRWFKWFRRRWWYLGRQHVPMHPGQRSIWKWYLVYRRGLFHCPVSHPPIQTTDPVAHKKR